MPLTEFSDEVIKKMYDLNLIEEMVKVFPERRDSNISIPKEAILVLALSAKLQRLCAITDIPVATMNVDILERIGYQMKMEDNNIFSEGEVRKFVNKYKAEELIEYYNQIVQNVINKMKYNDGPKVHQHDSTELEVNFNNENYENATVTKGKKGHLIRGYKLNCCRMMLEFGGLIERISMSGVDVHDFESSREMLTNAYHIKENDILAYDRGYIDRDTINVLKNDYKVSVIVPVKTNMDIFKKAIKIAQEKGKWSKHPNLDRDKQEIAFVEGLGGEWACAENVNKKIEKETKKDVDLNACVIRYPKDDKYKTEEELTQTDEAYSYMVFVTSATNLNAAEIIRNYETRAEIEEDYRQLKDVWGLKKFTSTKYNFIVFHIVLMLLGYMFYIVYKNTNAGEKYGNKTLKTILKEYRKIKENTYVPVSKLIIFWKNTFGIIEFTEFMDKYADLSIEKRAQLKKVLKKPIW